jgi:hypothetical protein
VHRTAYGLAGCIAAISAYIHSYNSLQLSAATADKCAAVTSADQGAGAIDTALPRSHNNIVSGTSSSSAALADSSSSSNETERSSKRQRCSDATNFTTTATAGAAVSADGLNNSMISSTAAEDAVTVQLLHPDSSCSSGNTATAATVGVTVIPGNSSNGNNSSDGSNSSSGNSGSSSSSLEAQVAALLMTALYELDMVTLMGCPATRAAANQVSFTNNSPYIYKHTQQLCTTHA